MSRIKNKQIEISSDFDINNNKLTKVSDPVLDDDAANKGYVDDAITSSSGVIGEAEDGDYTDGLFKDLDTDTAIGVPIDRFNEVLGALAPPPAPNLSNWNATLSGDVGGKLSFDSTYPISGYANANIDQDGYNPNISRDGIWTISGKRLGIIAANANNDITGTLNYQVPADTGTPNPSYPADSFGDADKGTLTLYVNGVMTDSIDIESITGAINSTNGNTTSGFIVSAASAIKFPSGSELDLFKYRTGTFRVTADDVNIQNGYNWIVVEHYINSSLQRTLARHEFIVDSSTDLTTYTPDVLDTLSMTGSKHLSGIEFYTGGTAAYGITISNAYKDTYSTSSSAISFIEGNGNIPNQSIPALGSDADNNTDISIASTFTISSNIRLIDDQISAQTSVLRTVQATQNSAGASISNILMDAVNASSTLTVEAFNDENYRLKSDSNYDTYDLISTNTWNSTESIADAGLVGYNDGLQTIGGDLVYPSNSAYPSNFSTISNGPVGNPDYTSASGNRTYIRSFRQVAPTTGVFVMNIQGSGGTFVSNTTSLSGDNIHVFVKAPGLAGEVTGWMDAWENFATAAWSDNDGMRSENGGVGRAFNTNWGLTIGSLSTSASSGYMLVKIVVGPLFSGTFTGITFNFG